MKSCPRVPKLNMWLRKGWGRCVKVTLQTRALKNFRSCRWGDERTRQACTDGKRGPPSARAEIYHCNIDQDCIFAIIFIFLCIPSSYCTYEQWFAKNTLWIIVNMSENSQIMYFLDPKTEIHKILDLDLLAKICPFWRFSDISHYVHCKAKN